MLAFDIDGGIGICAHRPYPRLTFIMDAGSERRRDTNAAATALTPLPPAMRCLRAAALAALLLVPSARAQNGCEPGVDEPGRPCSACGARCAATCALVGGERLCVPVRGEGGAGCGDEPDDGVCAPDVLCDGAVCARGAVLFCSADRVCAAPGERGGACAVSQAGEEVCPEKRCARLGTCVRTGLAACVCAWRPLKRPLERTPPYFLGSPVDRNRLIRRYIFIYKPHSMTAFSAFYLYQKPSTIFYIKTSKPLTNLVY